MAKLNYGKRFGSNWAVGAYTSRLRNPPEASIKTDYEKEFEALKEWFKLHKRRKKPCG